MRRLSILAVFAVAALSGTTGDAAAERYWPWCSRYGWSTICAYATFQQCQAGVSGAGGYCVQNVMPPPLIGYASPRVRQRRHRH